MNAKTIRGFLIGVALAVSAAALAQSVGYFPPPDWSWTYNGGVVAGSATGGLKGAGTINAQGLFVNNVAVSAGATVSSVGLSDASAVPIYTIGATPITTSGTITLTLNSQSAHMIFAGPTSSSAQPTFRALVAADVPTLNQNTTGSAGSATNVLGGLVNQILVQSAANATTFVAAPTTGGTALEWNGSTFIWATPSGTGCAGANPTASIGLTAVNGSASSCIRSDGAPALSQAISPTWTQLHSFSLGLTVTGGGAASTSVTAVSLNNLSSLPVVQLVNSSAGTNAKTWIQFVDTSGVLHFQLINDAINAGADVLTIARSGITPGIATFSGGSHGIVYQFSANVTSVTTSSVACYGGCGSPSASRTTTGTYVYTHNIGVASLEWTCSVQNSAGNAPGVEPSVSTGSTTSNAVTINFYNFAGSLADPAASSQVVCAALYPT
jgi:hypothetical protein